jgi:hypothetical protein
MKLRREQIMRDFAPEVEGLYASFRPEAGLGAD